MTDLNKKPRRVGYPQDVPRAKPSVPYKTGEHDFFTGDTRNDGALIEKLLEDLERKKGEIKAGAEEAAQGRNENLRDHTLNTKPTKPYKLPDRLGTKGPSTKTDDKALISSMAARLSQMEKIAQTQQKELKAKDDLVAELQRENDKLIHDAEHRIGTQNSPREDTAVKTQEPTILVTDGVPERKRSSEGTMTGGGFDSEKQDYMDTIFNMQSEIINLKEEVDFYIKENGRLRKRVFSMESFFQDYGYTWVGDDGDEDSDPEQWYPGVAAPVRELPKESRPAYASPYENLPDPTQANQPAPSGDGGPEVVSDITFAYNVDKVLANIEELNAVAGKNEQEIIETGNNKVAFKIPDPITLTLYSNGIMVNQGPFRSFEDADTRRYVRDLEDGYFPYEYKTLYPEGVAFRSIDKRSEAYKAPFQPFSGSGQAIGGAKKPSRLVPTNMKPYMPQSNKVITVRDGGVGEPDQLMERCQFLQKLPEAVIKNGNIVNVRADIGKLLGGEESERPDSTVVIQTSVTDELMSTRGSRSSSPRDITTLKVKSCEGKTYVVKLEFDDTIETLRNHLNSISKVPFELRTAFPRRTYDNLSETLREAGLVPNATLAMHPLASV